MSTGRNSTYIVLLTFLVVGVFACRHPLPEEEVLPPGEEVVDYGTPYDLVIPPFFPPMDIPADNPLTVEGVELGRYLFWEKKLSGNNTMSCGSCHLPDKGFSDPNQFSIGETGAIGTRQAMPLVNMGWSTTFFWDGRAPTLEVQILEPIENPIEMNDSWINVVQEIASDPLYPPKFAGAFGSTEVTKEKIAKAIASFLRTMISADSKFDRQRIGQYFFTEEEQRGFNLFITEGGDPQNNPTFQGGADCFHCHGFGAMQMTDYLFHNNGLDASFEDDPGRFLVTLNELDSGKFKTPSLRNIELTSPYMHDGRFTTLEQVIEHYNGGGTPSSTIDPFMKFTTGGLQLTDQKKADLLAFLKCLTDTSFLTNPAFQDPH
jgi:cytochrome c peroxidase